MTCDLVFPLTADVSAYEDIYIYAAYIGEEYILYYFTLLPNKWVGLGRDLRNAILVLMNFMNKHSKTY